VKTASPETIKITYTWDSVNHCLKTGAIPQPFAYAIYERLSAVLNPIGIRAVLVAQPLYEYTFKLIGGMPIQNFAQANKLFVDAESKQSKAIPDAKETVKRLSIEALVYDPQKVGASYLLYTQDFDQGSASTLAESLAQKFQNFDGIDVNIEATSKVGAFRIGLSGPAITRDVNDLFVKRKKDQLERLTAQKVGELAMPLQLEADVAAGDAARVKQLLQKNVEVTEHVVRQAISSSNASAVITELLPTFNATLLIKAIEYAENRVVEEAKGISLSSSSSSSIDTEAKQAKTPEISPALQILQLLLDEYEKIVRQVSSVVLKSSQQMLTFNCHESSPNVITLRVNEGLNVLEAKEAEDALRELSLVKRYGLDVNTITHSDESCTVEISGALFANGFGHYLQKERRLRSSAYKPNGDGHHQALASCLCIPIPVVNAGMMSKLFSSQPGKMNYTWDKTDGCVQSLELNSAAVADQARTKLIVQLASA